MKKTSKKKKIIAAAVTLALVGAVTGGVVYGKTTNQMPGTEIMVQETTAQTSTISDTIVGTGNLETDVGTPVTIPSGIVIEEVKAESGDQVAQGDVLATVDPNSVTDAMAAVQEEINALDETINGIQEETKTEAVTAKLDGRVKKIYVEEGGDVTSAMLENSALMILSIDGKMAVDLENVSGISASDSVTVTLPDGTEEAGSVEGVSGTSATVTWSDYGTALNDDVTVIDSDGNILGTGTAYIHQKLEITAIEGTVTEIHVSEEESVTGGTELMTIDLGENTAEYKEQIAKRETLAESLKKLIALAQTGTVTADSNGTVGEINVSDGKEALETSGNASVESDSASASAVNVSKVSYRSGDLTQEIMTLSTGTCAAPLPDHAEVQETEDGVQTEESPAEELDGEIAEEITEETTEEDSEEETEQEENPPESSELSFQVVDAGSSTQSTLALERPVTGNKPQTGLSSADGSYTGIVSWSPGSGVFEGETSYMAQITLQASEGYKFGIDSIFQIQTGLLSGVSVSEDGKSMSFQITFPATDAIKNDVNNENGAENNGQAENQEEEDDLQNSGAAESESSEYAGAGLFENNIQSGGENAASLESDAQNSGDGGTALENNVQSGGRTAVHYRKALFKAQRTASYPPVHPQQTAPVRILPKWIHQYPITQRSLLSH